jgi:hypothetical protein
VVGVTKKHDGGYNGSMQLVPLKIEVPAGMNLAYKLKLKKWEGGSHYDSFNPPRDMGVVETMTYWAQGPKKKAASNVP